jgi:hypothetical protein
MAVSVKDVCGQAHLKRGVWEKVCFSQQSDAFKVKMVQVAQRLGMDPSWLAAAIAFESGFNPQAVNPISGATGLIQFMPKSTAPQLGTSQAELLKMSAIQQLDYVEKYFTKFHANRSWKGPQDVYFAIFLPVLIGKGLDDVAAKAGSPIYDQNRGFDRYGKGYFTARDVAQPILSILSSADSKPLVIAAAAATIGAAVWFGVAVGAYLAWRKMRKARRLPVPV